MNQNLVDQNRELNEQEYRDKKIVLESYPQAIFTQMDAPCNHDCLFCSRPETYSHFDLEEFRKDFEDILMPVFQRVSRINLTGSGELLFLPEAKKNLDYFNSFEHAEKMFATNGSSLTPKMIDHIFDSGNRYLIHVSMHAASEETHKRMVKANTHQIVTEHLKYIKKTRKGRDNLQFNLIFVATTENISELPEFIRMAYEFEAAGVVVYFHYVYRMDQKLISCYFDQKHTNSMLSRAKEEKDRLSAEYGRTLNLQLPPEFGHEYGKDDNLCSEAWSQIMVNTHGDIISCDVAGDSNENVKGKSDFMEVWNGKYYTELRQNLVDKKFDCASFCFRANPNKVNELKSHIITRGKTKEELAEFLEE